MVAATTPPAPSVRTVTSEEATNTAPMKPPTKYHHGTPLSPSRWVPPDAPATTNSATVPTMNEIVAAANVPTAPPSFELIGGCIATSIPAAAERRRAIPLVTRSRAASLRGQPVVADAGVHPERRVERIRLRHLAHHDLARGLDL